MTVFYTISHGTDALSILLIVYGSIHDHIRWRYTLSSIEWPLHASDRTWSDQSGLMVKLDNEHQPWSCAHPRYRPSTTRWCTRTFRSLRALAASIQGQAQRNGHQRSFESQHFFVHIMAFSLSNWFMSMAKDSRHGFFEMEVSRKLLLCAMQDNSKPPHTSQFTLVYLITKLSIFLQQ